MEHSFWHQKWEKNEIGFHQAKPNDLLARHFDKLSLSQGSRIFLPLCGKTLDIGWFLSNGYQVTGAELSELAIVQLFAGLEIDPEVAEIGPLKRYHAENIDIFVGDIFDLTAEILGPVDAIYDRAALVALPDEMRIAYVNHMLSITKSSPQLLITLEYDPSLMKGPPFPVGDAEVKNHYAKHFEIIILEEADVTGALKGNIPVQQSAWYLKKMLQPS